MKVMPCPFCRGTDLATPVQIGIVVCATCGACGPTATIHPKSDKLTELAAFSKWNVRVLHVEAFERETPDE